MAIAEDKREDYWLRELHWSVSSRAEPTCDDELPRLRGLILVSQCLEAISGGIQHATFLLTRIDKKSSCSITERKGPQTQHRHDFAAGISARTVKARAQQSSGRRNGSGSGE